MNKFFDILRNERGEVGFKKDDDTDDDDIIVPDPALDDEIVDDYDDDTDDDKGDLEIDLDEPEKKHPAAIRLDKDKQKLKEDNERLMREVAELNVARTQPAPVIPTGDQNNYNNWTEAQWDELANKDWKKAVDLRAEIKARQLYANQASNTEFLGILESSKSKVLTRHPELGDELSEKSKIYRNVVTANPEYTSMKEGPLFAMYKMEEFMEKNMGYRREDIVKAEAQGRAAEQGRLNRVSVMSTTGRNVTGGNKIVITKDEREFCEMQGIDPKVYAQNKKKLESSGNRGGIQL